MGSKICSLYEITEGGYLLNFIFITVMVSLWKSDIPVSITLAGSIHALFFLFFLFLEGLPCFPVFALYLGLIGAKILYSSILINFSSFSLFSFSQRTLLSPVCTTPCAFLFP